MHLERCQVVQGCALNKAVASQLIQPQGRGVGVHKSTAVPECLLVVKLAEDCTRDLTCTGIMSRRGEVRGERVRRAQVDGVPRGADSDGYEVW